MNARLLNTTLLRQLLVGVASYVPGLLSLRNPKTGGTNSARYCYTVWLRHLIMAAKTGLDTHPRVVAELGPGDSLGIGLAALLSGADQYYAFDVVRYANTSRNLTILDELVDLFRHRADLPGDEEWPGVNPRLADYRFPRELLDDERLQKALAPSRLARIRRRLTLAEAEDSLIQYWAPWYEAANIQPESVDMVYSQAVLEHVDDLSGAYRAMNLWLKPGGYMSHQIDYRSHRTADRWNGHWTYPDIVWRIILGRRPYLLNRQPHSRHLELLAEAGFVFLRDQRVTAVNLLTAKELAPQFRSLTQRDLTTRGALVQAVKPMCVATSS